MPCKCSGSVGFVHFKCLKSWLDTKVIVKSQGNIQTLFWRSFECELCKHAYPYIFKVEDITYKLVDIPKKSGHFLVMESLPLERNTSRTVHMLQFNDSQKQFKMGRGHDSEVRVNDISVSRCHAVINYRADGIFIMDNRSKFGTLVQIKNKEVELGGVSTFQIGRSVCSFMVESHLNQGQQERLAERGTMEDEAALTSSEASQSPVQ